MEQDSSSLPDEDGEKPPPWKWPEVNRSFFVGKNLYPFYPHFYEQTLTPKLQEYYGSNGHLALIKTLKIKIVSDIDVCQELWEEFTPAQSLFDTWDFRYAFWLGYRHKPHFILLGTAKENIALLPLWYEAEKQKYFWFGSQWHEDNRFFVKDSTMLPLLLAVCPTPTLLNAINHTTAHQLRDMITLKKDESKYVLRLNALSSVDEFLAGMKKKRRYNLKRDKRIIEEQGVKLILNRFEDYNSLVALSIKRFNEKGEEHTWADPGRVETFSKIIKLGRQPTTSFSVKMITAEIGGRIAGVDLVAIYKDCYYPLKGGNNVSAFPGIGTYLNLIEIEDAMKLGMRKIDFLEEDCGWKHRWFEEIPLYQYEKGSKSIL